MVSVCQADAAAAAVVDFIRLNLPSNWQLEWPKWVRLLLLTAASNDWLVWLERGWASSVSSCWRNYHRICSLDRKANRYSRFLICLGWLRTGRKVKLSKQLWPIGEWCFSHALVNVSDADGKVIGCWLGINSLDGT